MWQYRDSVHMAPTFVYREEDKLSWPSRVVDVMQVAVDIEPRHRHSKWPVTPE